MKKYYTRVCNFAYGKSSIKLVNKKKNFPLNGNKELSFSKVEIITQDSKKIIDLTDIKKLPKSLREKIYKDLKIIIKKNNNFSNLNFKKTPNIMGILNLTPDSFSDGGKFNTKKTGIKHAINLLEFGADIVDVGGESTRPGSKFISEKEEWSRIEKIIKKIGKKIPLSLDTRKSDIMNKGIKLGIRLINDVSGLSFDSKTIEVLKKSKSPFVIQHSQGTPENMQKNPKYKNELLEIYDFFEKKIKFLRSRGIKHNNIIIDPGIGFGKNLKHNLIIMNKISLFHSLGFPLLIGTSRKRFISQISGLIDSKERIGGTLASVLYTLSQGVQIFRVHNVHEVKQAILVYKKIISI